MPIDPKFSQMLFETFKAELQELHQSLVNALLSLEKATTDELVEETLKSLFRYSHNMKGAAACASVDTIASIAHRLEDLFSEWRQNHYVPDKVQINACLEVVDNTLLALKDHNNGERIDIENYLAPLTGGKTIHKNSEELTDNEFIKLPLMKIERANAKANEFITYRLKLANWFKAIDYSLKELNQLNINDSSLTPLINKMMSITSDSGQFFGEFSRSVQALQDDLTAMRMRPISTIFTPLARTVRDIAATLNKSVELQVLGGDIELDQTIIDAIKDPLIHLVRNAIDHGVESDDKRKELNKPLPAKLTVQVSQSSGKIKLQCCDDGQGIDLEQIKKHALSIGLYTENELKEFDDNQILECIFMSGFSLQTEVTELSGRGVGLDAVKNDIQRMKGSISVNTTPGQGSCFTLTLPLTLATTRGVFFKIQDQIFMLPTLSLEALYEIKTDDLKLVDNKYILVVEDKPVPLKILSNLLHSEHIILEKNKTYYGLLINSQQKQLLFLVDAIIDERDCVVKPLPFPYSKLELYIGVTLTVDSELALVLDPLKLMQIALLDERSWIECLEQTTDKHMSVLKKRILIVDDSLTTRSLCSNALEAAGFETKSVVDGKKAWQLMQNEAFDCVITDIVMPEMDGFELTKMIKDNKKYAHIPVIIVSLLHSKSDQQKGLEAGANAFIVKSEFDTRSLIELMESLL